MKKQIWLWLLLLVFAASCGDDFEERTYSDEVFEKIAPFLKDTDGFDKASLGEDGNRGISFLKNGKLWIGLFNDSDRKQLIKEWISEFNVPANAKRVLFDNNLSSYKSDDEYSGFITLLNEDAGFVTTYWLHLLADGSVKIIYQFEKEKAYSPTYTIYGDYSLLKFNNDDHSSDKEIYLFYQDSLIAKNTTVVYDNNKYFFTGFQNDILKIDVYDVTEDTIQTWSSQAAFEKILKVHQGYGEYETYEVDSIRLMNILTTKWGYAAIATYGVSDMESKYREINDGMLILNSQGKIIKKGIDMNSLNYDFLLYYCNWYNQSILIYDANVFTVISPDGKDIFNSDVFNYLIGVSFEPISYEEAINIRDSYIDKWSISRYNLRTKEVRWETSLDTLTKIVDPNSQLTVSIESKSGNIWRYKCDILYYDGSTKQVSFAVNIDTGEIVS